MSEQIDQELPVPSEAMLLGGQEVLRAFIVADDLHVSLANAFQQPDVWGVLLVDIAGHVADMYAAKSGQSRDETLARIRTSFDAEWARSTAGPAAEFTN